MRRLFLLFAVLCVVLLFGSDSPKEYDDRTQIVGIEGTWQMIEIEFMGEKNKPRIQEVMTFRSGTWTDSRFGEGDSARAKYRIDSTLNPSHLDRISSNGHTCMYIYQLDGDTIRISYVVAAADKKRPKGFNDDWIAVLTYKRVK